MWRSNIKPFQKFQKAKSTFVCDLANNLDLDFIHKENIQYPKISTIYYHILYRLNYIDVPQNLSPDTNPFFFLNPTFFSRQYLFFSDELFWNNAFSLYILTVLRATYLPLKVFAFRVFITKVSAFTPGGNFFLSCNC